MDRNVELSMLFIAYSNRLFWKQLLLVNVGYQRQGVKYVDVGEATRLPEIRTPDE